MDSLFQGEVQVSFYRFGRQDVRPESKVTQTRPHLPRERHRRIPLDDDLEREALDEAQRVLYGVDRRPTWGGGFITGLCVGLLGALLLYAATHLH